MRMPYIQVIRKGGRDEAGFQLNASEFADQGGLRRADAKLGQCGFRLTACTQKAAGCAVYGHRAANRFDGSAPVDAVGLGHCIGGHPDG